MIEPLIEGVAAGRLVRHADPRGAFREIWRASLDAERRFVQANLSSSEAGVLRGVHVHRRQLDYWVVVRGRAFVALVDTRPAIAGSGDVVVASGVLDADDWLVIPAGVAHGFLALEPLDLLYLVTNEYDGSDELGFRWDDPQAAIPWPGGLSTPDGRPILSERDAASPSLADALARLGA